MEPTVQQERQTLIQSDIKCTNTNCISKGEESFLEKFVIMKNLKEAETSVKKCQGV